jgi:hypothetical protein
MENAGEYRYPRPFLILEVSPYRESSKTSAAF